LTLEVSHIRIIRASRDLKELSTERTTKGHLTDGLLPLRFIVASWREHIPEPLMKGFLPECYKPFLIEEKSSTFLPYDIDGHFIVPGCAPLYTKNGKLSERRRRR
jgi:hypothetical protein